MHHFSIGEAETLLACINERHQVKYVIQTKFHAGWNEGAYALVNDTGERLVLKCYQYQPPMLRRLRLACKITDLLHTKGVPVPVTRLIEVFSGETIAWIIDALPGKHTEQLTTLHLGQLLTFNELQAGQALSRRQNWSNYVRAVVFDGESGWTEALGHYSSASHVLLRRLKQFVVERQDCSQERCDIVHGDCNYYNILVDGEQVSGIVDWDAAGCGDRLLDLFPLLFDAHYYRNNGVYCMLRTYILRRISRECLLVYTTYLVLARVAWSIARDYPSEEIAQSIEEAHVIIDDLAEHY